MKSILISLLFFGLTGIALADEQKPLSLEDQLKSLEMPSNRGPEAQASEKLYSVQSRYSSLNLRSEFLLGMGKNFGGDSFLNSREVGLGYRIHFNSTWSLGVQGAYVFNEMTDAGYRLLDSKGLLPDAAYTKTKADLMLGFNLLYGKFRLGMDQVFYFDYFFQAGPGYIKQSTGSGIAAVGETGIAFWMGRWGSTRLSVRDYVHSEKTRANTKTVHDIIGSIQVGFLLGKGDGI